MNEEEIEKKLKPFIGNIQQIPPMYSAIKINGKKLYEYAREGIIVEREPRNITIYKIEIIEFNEEKQELTIEVECSKGTYIRVLAEDIAEKLGTVGTLKNLQRTVVGDFKIENSIKLEELEKLNLNEIQKHIIHVYGKSRTQRVFEKIIFLEEQNNGNLEQNVWIV